MKVSFMASLCINCVQHEKVNVDITHSVSHRKLLIISYFVCGLRFQFLHFMKDKKIF